MGVDTQPHEADHNSNHARAALYCSACGFPCPPPARFCARCGRPVVSAPADQAASGVATAPIATIAPTPVVLSARPFWPWVLALGGLVVATIYGLQALTAYEVMQRVEASSAVSVAKGLDFLARLFPSTGAGAVGQFIEPRNQELYVQARERFCDIGMG
jgi:hypothetical protein